jgi:putative ABC transport system permease protein
MRNDLRYALRGLARNPGFALAAILTLALGIGAVTSVLSVADAVLIRPLPYPNQDRLVMVWDQLTKLQQYQFPVRELTYVPYSHAEVFESAGAYRVQTATLTGLGEATRLTILSASASLLPMLGARPELGRGFEESENRPGHANVAILSHSFFMSRFGGNRDALGRSLTLDGNPYTIVGVMPGDFQFSLSAESPEVWTPIALVDHGFVQWSAFDMIARLRPGVSIATAQAALEVIAKHLEETLLLYRGPNGEDAGYGVKVVSLHEQSLGGFRTATILLLSAVGGVLLIALANVSNLLLVRAVSREQEFAIRRAIGASESRLARQWMVEGAVLAAIGGVLGAVASLWGLRALVALSPAALPAAARVTVDGHALAMTLAIAAVVSILFGLAPLTAGRSNLRGYRRRRTAPALISAEVALAMTLLISASLLLKSFAALRHVDAGFHPEHLLTMQMDLPHAAYPEPRQRIAFYSALHDRLSSLPGVISAGLVRSLPVLGKTPQSRGGNPFSIEGRAWNPNGAVPQLAHTPSVDPDYFRTMQIPLLTGRVFTDTDTATSEHVAVVNETLARGFFPKGALGEHIMLGAPRSGYPWLTIVGVVGDVKTAGLDETAVPQFYTPLTQDASPFLAVVLRTSGDPRQMARTATAAVHSIDSDRPVYQIETMEQRITTTIAQPRFEAVVVGFFGIAALFLAAIGIFGVVAHSTAQRTREIGIRIALGADSGRVVRYVMLTGLRPVLAGALIGIAGALAAGRMLASVLFHVKPTDPATFAIAACVLGLVAAGACLGPARKAARIDPAAALGSE